MANRRTASSGTRARVSLIILGLVVCAILASCGQKPPAFSPQAARTTEIPSTPAAASTDVFRVDAWMSDPTPPRNTQVILFGSLIKNPYYLNGIMMRAYWPDAETPEGSPDCFVMVNYQRGVCRIDAGKFPPGVFVPIQITIEYKGVLYSGQTGFTPK